MEGVQGASPKRHGNRKRRHSLRSKRGRLRSQSPFFDWKDVDETEPPSLSGRSGNESQLPSSDGPESASEVDWESFLCEDAEMLPASNWEAEFLKHKAKVMAVFDYRGLLYGDFNENNEETTEEDTPVRDNRFLVFSPAISLMVHHLYSIFYWDFLKQRFLLPFAPETCHLRKILTP
jgi:hypothetical protein